MANTKGSGTKQAKRAPKGQAATSKTPEINRITTKGRTIKLPGTQTSAVPSPPKSPSSKRKANFPESDNNNDDQVDKGDESNSSQDYDSDCESQWEDEMAEGDTGGFFGTGVKYNIALDKSHIPLSPDQRKKTGRKPGRDLINWQPHYFHPWSTGSAILQHLNRLRSHLFMRGHLVPPPFPKTGAPISPEELRIRGFMRVDEGDGTCAQKRAVGFAEHIPDNKHDRPDYNVTTFPLDTAFDDADLVDALGNLLLKGGLKKRGKAAHKKAVAKKANNGNQGKQASPEATVGAPTPATSEPVVPESAVTEPIGPVEPEVFSPVPSTQAAPIALVPRASPAPAAVTAAAPVRRARTASKGSAKKKPAAKKVASMDPADLSSDADYNPSAKATPKRRRSSRSKRVKTYHEPEISQDSERDSVVEAVVTNAQTASITNTSETVQPAAESTAEPASEAEQIQEARDDAAAFEAQMSEHLPNVDTDMEMGSAIYDESSHEHVSSPSEISSADVEEYHSSVQIVSASDLQVHPSHQAHHLDEMIQQGYLPPSMFTRSGSHIGSPSFNTHHHDHNIDGASSSSAVTHVNPPSSGGMFYGNNAGFNTMLHPQMKADPQMMAGHIAHNAGSYVHPHQVFSMNVPLAASQRSAIVNNCQAHASTGLQKDPRNSPGFHSPHFTGGNI
ncbi:chaperonin [Sporothrix eucalyptigena]